ncbi:MAG: hypothetical protein ACR2JG_12690 [Geodermatophilaceae bacterium]
MNVDFVREAFREDAQLARPPAPNLYESVLAQRRRADRRRWASLAAGLAVLLVAVAVPVGISLVGPGADQVAAPPTIPDADVFGGPTRGSLAGDAGFVEAVRQLSWAVPGAPAAAEIPDAPVETRQVVFAGDVAGGRWALVVGQNISQLPADTGAREDLGIAGVWFLGPSGASPEQMQMLSNPRPMRPDVPVALYQGPSGALVVVAAPGDVIEVSPRPEVAADATVTRDNFVDTGSTDGVAVSTLDPNPYVTLGGSPIQYRVIRGGAVVAEQGPDTTNGTAIVPEIDLNYLRPPVYVPFATDVQFREQQMASQILGEYGLQPDQVELQVRYVGPVPGRSGSTGELTVLSATFPSGAVLTRAFWEEQISSPQPPHAGAGFGGGDCANDLSAEGVPAAERVIAIRCDVGAGVGDGQLPDPVSTLVVLIPPGLAAGSVIAESSPSQTTFILSTISLSDPGLAMAPYPDGAEKVLIRAADGAVLDEVPIISL